MVGVGTAISVSGVSINSSNSGRSSAIGHTTQKTIANFTKTKGYGAAEAYRWILKNPYVACGSHGLIADIFTKDTVNIAS